jgi:hypothetical protein
MRNQSRMVCLILSVSSPEIRSASQRNRYPGRMRRIKMSAMAQSGHLGAADNCPLLGAKRMSRKTKERPAEMLDGGRPDGGDL